MIIILNGTSSSGKTSIVHAIQDNAEEIYLEYGIDKFIFMLPRRYLYTSLWNDVLGRADAAGAVGYRLVKDMHAAAQSLHKRGTNLVMDHVLVEEEWKKDLEMVLKDESVYMVKVHCPDHVLEEREKSRKDRTLGQALKQTNLVHKNIEYDMEIDTSIMNSQSAAKMILEYVANNKPKWKYSGEATS